MRILVVFTFGVSLKTWHDQGLLDRELLLYKRLHKEGYAIGLLTYGDETDLGLKKDLGGMEVFPVYLYMKRPNNRIFRILSSFTIPFRLGRILKEYDIYKTNQMFGSWVAVIAKFMYRKKLVIRCGYEWLRNSFRESRGIKKLSIVFFGYFIELIAYGAADKIMVTSPGISSFIKRLFRPFARKAVYIPNFVDTDSFKKTEDALKRRDNRALYIGRLDKTKNLINLFEAVKNSRHKIGLDVAGNGEYYDELKEFVDETGTDVRFLGTVPNSELPALINNYPVFTLVSLFENNPKALLEAMACERVVVGSDVEGINELISDNVSGILVTADVVGIKDGLERAFSLSAEERTDLGRRARETATKRSSSGTIFKKEAGLYEELRS